MNPGEQGYYFPAEFAKHSATWLSWPHKEASWPGKIETIYRLDVTSAEFGIDFAMVFQSAVNKARRENKRVLGTTDLEPE